MEEQKKAKRSFKKSFSSRPKKTVSSKRVTTRKKTTRTTKPTSKRVFVKKTYGKSKEDEVKVCFLGGLAAVAERNMVTVEYRDQIIILDAGLMFPNTSTPGIDYIIPDVDYLEKNKEKIVGMFITHGHYDHIGAIPHVMEKIGNPIIYTAPLTRGMIIKRQTDFPNAPKLKIQQIDTSKELEEIKVGHFKVHPFLIGHTIPDSLGFAVETVHGNIFYIPDFKFDLTPIVDKPVDMGRITELAKKPLLLMADSTGAEIPGYTLSERVIYNDLDKIFDKSKGRIIAATFSSLLNRIQQIIWLAEKHDRRVVVDGYSMKSNVAIARELGYLKVERNTIISPQEAQALPDSKVVIICTGAQGEDNAVLMRIANKEHRFFKIKKEDSIIFSSSVVPGNEHSVQGLKDLFHRQGANVFHYKMMDIHSSGHGHQGDLKLMLNLIRPKFFIPMHGSYSMLKAHAKLAEEVGVDPKNILITDDGKMIGLSENKIRLTGEEVPTNHIMVDGLGVGDVNDVILRDRNQLAQDGMVIIVSMIDGKSGKIKGTPEITNRGFSYGNGSKEKEFKKQLVKLIGDIISKTATRDRTSNWTYVKDNLRDRVGDFLFKKTQKRPIVLPFVVEV